MFGCSFSVPFHATVAGLVVHTKSIQIIEINSTNQGESVEPQTQNEGQTNKSAGLAEGEKRKQHRDGVSAHKKHSIQNK